MTILSTAIDGSTLGSEVYRHMSFFMLIFSSISCTIASLNITKKLSTPYIIIISILTGLSAVFALTLMIILLNEFGDYGSISAGPILAIIAGTVTAGAPWLQIKEA